MDHLFANDGMMEKWNGGKPKGKPQRGEMFVELGGQFRIWRCSAPEYELELLGIRFYP